MVEFLQNLQNSDLFIAIISYLTVNAGTLIGLAIGFVKQKIKSNKLSEEYKAECEAYIEKMKDETCAILDKVYDKVQEIEVKFVDTLNAKELARKEEIEAQKLALTESIEASKKEIKSLDNILES